VGRRLQLLGELPEPGERPESLTSDSRAVVPPHANGDSNEKRQRRFERRFEQRGALSRWPWARALSPVNQIADTPDLLKHYQHWLNLPAYQPAYLAYLPTVPTCRTYLPYLLACSSLPFAPFAPFGR
jgi:hypothetical protein